MRDEGDEAALRAVGGGRGDEIDAALSGLLVNRGTRFWAGKIDRDIDCLADEIQSSSANRRLRMRSRGLAAEAGGTD